MNKKFDVYEMVTDKICALLEQGVIPWTIPWSNTNTAHAWSRLTGKPYSFLNHLLLARKKQYNSIAELMDEVCGEWLTFNQIKKLGGHVRAGEQGQPVVFFKWIERETEYKDEITGEPVKKQIPCLQYYYVFKIDQCEGIEKKHHTDDGETYDFTQDLTAEQVSAGYLNRYGIKLEHVNGNKAFYCPTDDKITLPLPEQFKDNKEYYSTLFHEETHSTGHASRLNRLSKTAAFGNEEYSVEELTAEIGSASILATLGIDTEGTLRNSAAYIQNWLKVLRNDKKMIVFAAAKAEKAIKMILGIEETKEEATA